MKITPCIVGLGYVGLPIALALSKKFFTYGFDINNERIACKNKITNFYEEGFIEVKKNHTSQNN